MDHDEHARLARVLLVGQCFAWFQNKYTRLHLTIESNQVVNCGQDTLLPRPVVNYSLGAPSVLI